MLKPWFLKIHGWLAFLCSIPLIILCVTGLILGIEPIVQHSSIEPGTVTVEEVTGYLRKYDPEGKATALVHRSYENSLTIGGVGSEGEIEIDLVTRQESVSDGGWYWSEIFSYNRRLHEHVSILNVDLTIAATIAMCVIIALGILLGLPRIRNTVAGWHKAISWYLLPALIISPLTGLFIAWGVSMNMAPAVDPGRSKPLPMIEAVQVVGKDADLSRMIWLRQRGGRQLVRLWDGQEARVFAVTKEGLKPVPRNISRMIHEGNFLGIWSGLLKIITAAALLALIGTGLYMFISKQLRKFRNKRARALEAASA